MELIGMRFPTIWIAFVEFNNLIAVFIMIYNKTIISLIKIIDNILAMSTIILMREWTNLSLMGFYMTVTNDIRWRILIRLILIIPIIYMENFLNKRNIISVLQKITCWHCIQSFFPCAHFIALINCFPIMRILLLSESFSRFQC